MVLEEHNEKRVQRGTFLQENIQSTIERGLIIQYGTYISIN